MLHMQQINAQLKTIVLNFTPHVNFLDPADCSIEQSAENLRAVPDYCARTYIPPKTFLDVPVTVHMITNSCSFEISSTKHDMLHAEDSKPELLRAEEPQSLHMIIQDPLVDHMKILYDCFFVKLDLEHLDIQDQPVDVTVTPHSTYWPILFSPIHPEITVGIPVLNLAVSPDLGPPASNPVTPVTYAQMLVSKIRTTAAANPLGTKIM